MSAANPTWFIEHVVLFKVKPDVDSSKQTAMVHNLNTLSSIESVLHFAAGPIIRIRSPSLTFTHLIHGRYAAKADLESFSVHPTHLGVIKETKPLLEDIMAMDWWFSADSVTIPPGSALRVTFLKLKEDLEEKEKNELLGLIGGIKEKIPGLELLSFGENFSPGRAKGFSVGYIAVFKGRSELEGFDSELEAAVNEQKDLVRDKLDEAMVFDCVIP